MPGGTVVIRAGALGDVLLGIPALQELRHTFPGERIVLVAPVPQARLALRSGIVDEVVPFDHPWIGALLAGSAADLPEFLAGCDRAAVWLRSWQEPAQVLSRLGIARVIGESPFPSVGERTHAADWLMQSLAPFGVDLVEAWDAEPWLPVTEAERTVAGDALARSGLACAYVVLHPGSGSRRKNWPAWEWASVVAQLPARAQIVVTAGPADDEAVAALDAEWPEARPRFTILAGVPLETLIGVLAGARLYIGNDSGVTHLAAAVGAPTVAVFGPTDPAVWRPRGPRVTVLGGAPASGSDGIFAAQPSWPAVEQVVEATMRALSS